MKFLGNLERMQVQTQATKNCGSMIVISDSIFQKSAIYISAVNLLLK
jgi:hypothetical protein